MISSDITFEAVNVATILWPDYGFTPEHDGGIVAVGKKLTEYFTKEHIHDKLCETLGLDRENMVYSSPKFDAAKGNEHIKLTRLADIEIDGVTADEIIVRVHVCNRIERSRAKITIFANFEFRDHPLSAIEIVDLMDSVFKKEEDICRFIHKKIPESFSLGNIKYISNIASVESEDRDIDSIIKSVFLSDKTKFEFLPSSEHVLDEKKMLDAYYVLLSNKTLVSADRRSITPETIRDVIIDCKAKQSKTITYQTKNKIPAKTLNYESDPLHRVITNLTTPYCASAVTNRLVNDYLSMT